MPNSSTEWKPGQRAPGAHRPIGSRNKRTQEIVNKLLSLGHRDPLETLSELQHSSPEEAIRATAANMLAPYLHSKMGTIPIAPDPTFMEIQIKNPNPTSIDQCVENITLLTQAKASGECSIEHADSLINDQKIILYAMLDRQKQITAEGGAREQTIRIQGGLPLLPGTNVIMPKMNGHDPGPSPLEPDPQPDDNPPATPQT